MNRDEVLKKLREDPVFKAVLAAAKTSEERRMIKAYAEEFLLNFHRNVFEPMGRAMAANQSSISAGGLITSGTIDGQGRKNASTSETSGSIAIR